MSHEEVIRLIEALSSSSSSLMNFSFHPHQHHILMMTKEKIGLKFLQKHLRTSELFEIQAEVEQEFLLCQALPFRADGKTGNNTEISAFFAFHRVCFLEQKQFQLFVVAVAVPVEWKQLILFVRRNWQSLNFSASLLSSQKWTEIVVAGVAVVVVMMKMKNLNFYVLT